MQPPKVCVAPYNPRSQAGVVEWDGPTVVTVGLGGKEQLVRSNPDRLAILVVTSIAGGSWRVAPSQENAEFGFSTLNGGDGLVIHAATFPGLVQHEWYVYSPSGITLHVYEGRITHCE